MISNSPKVTIEACVKIIMFHALSIFVSDIRLLIQHHVEKSTWALVNHPDQAIASHAQQRREALKKWLKFKSPLAWVSESETASNVVSLSLMLCEDPNVANPVLALSDITYEAVVQNLAKFTTEANVVRPAPLTALGAFQYTLPIAFQMVSLMVPAGNDKLEYWNNAMITMMKSMCIHLIPWHKGGNAYATDPTIWKSLRRSSGLVIAQAVTLEDRIKVGADRLVHQDPQATWDLPDRLSDMKALWKKEVLPTCWSLANASLPEDRPDTRYVLDQYNYVLENYDGTKWYHHLALIVAICFSRVVPNICIDKQATITSSDGPGATDEIRAFEWVPAQSASKKGTSAPLPFIVMMSTALIGFWDSKSPLNTYLQSKAYNLGASWTDKHGNSAHIFLCFSFFLLFLDRYQTNTCFEFYSDGSGSCPIPWCSEAFTIPF